MTLATCNDPVISRAFCRPLEASQLLYLRPKKVDDEDRQTYMFVLGFSGSPRSIDTTITIGKELNLVYIQLGYIFPACLSTYLRIYLSISDVKSRLTEDYKERGR